MAKKPTDAVQFTYESAERIANVVRSAELTPPATRPLSFEPIPPAGRVKLIRAATFTGSWAIGTSKAVTFQNLPTATASALNLLWPISHNHTSQEQCIVGKDGTSWYLVVPRLEVATAAVYQTQQRTYAADGGLSQVVVGLALNASLNTTNCSITIGQTLTTAQIRVISQTQTALFVTSSLAASYLRMRAP